MIDDDASNLDRVIAGMAANRPNLAKFDCTLIDRAVVDDMGVELRKEPGNSKDREANRVWHYNLVDLSFLKLGELVRRIAAVGEPLRRDEEEVKALILRAIRGGFIVIEDLRPPEPGENSVWLVINEALRAEGRIGWQAAK